MQFITPVARFLFKKWLYLADRRLAQVDNIHGEQDCRAAPDRKLYDSRIGGRTNKRRGATIQFRHNGERRPEGARKRCANIAPVMLFCEV
jgi:hypothetical protein